MILYASTMSPYVRKARVVAAELGVDLTLETVPVHDFPSDYGRINPVHRIPALGLDDGTVLPDSRLICEYLDAENGHRLLPAAGAERWRILRLQVWGDGILDAAVPRRGELARVPEQQNQPRLDEYQRSIETTLDALEGHVDELAGINLGTIAVAVALGYLDFRFAHEDWRARRPKLAAWYAGFAERPSMQATLPSA